ANIALAQPGHHPRSRARWRRPGAFGPHARRSDQLATPHRTQRPEDRPLAASPQPPPDARPGATRLDSALRQPGTRNRHRAVALRLPAGDHTARNNQTLMPYAIFHMACEIWRPNHQTTLRRQANDDSGNKLPFPMSLTAKPFGTSSQA